jgi:hypothetical protein
MVIDYLKIRKRIFGTLVFSALSLSFAHAGLFGIKQPKKPGGILYVDEALSYADYISEFNSKNGKANPITMDDYKERLAYFSDIPEWILSFLANDQEALSNHFFDLELGSLIKQATITHQQGIQLLELSLVRLKLVSDVPINKKEDNRPLQSILFALNENDRKINSQKEEKEDSNSFDYIECINAVNIDDSEPNVNDDITYKLMEVDLKALNIKRKHDRCSTTLSYSLINKEDLQEMADFKTEENKQESANYVLATKITDVVRDANKIEAQNKQKLVEMALEQNSLKSQIQICNETSGKNKRQPNQINCTTVLLLEQQQQLELAKMKLQRDFDQLQQRGGAIPNGLGHVI